MIIITYISLHSRDDHGVGHLRLPVDEPVRLGEHLVDRRTVQQLPVVRIRVGEARLGGETLGHVAAEPHRLVPVEFESINVSFDLRSRLDQ